MYTFIRSKLRKLLSIFTFFQPHKFVIDSSIITEELYRYLYFYFLDNESQSIFDCCTLPDVDLSRHNWSKRKSHAQRSRLSGNIVLLYESNIVEINLWSAQWIKILICDRERPITDSQPPALKNTDLFG